MFPKLNYLEEHQASPLDSNSSSSWCPPLIVFCKINFYRAYTFIRSSSEAVIKDAYWNFVVASSLCTIASSLESVKALVARNQPPSCLPIRTKNILLEGDALAAINYIKENLDNSSWHLIVVIKDYKHLLNSFNPFFGCNYVNRREKHVTHAFVHLDWLKSILHD